MRNFILLNAYVMAAILSILFIYNFDVQNLVTSQSVNSFEFCKNEKDFSKCVIETNPDLKRMLDNQNRKSENKLTTLPSGQKVKIRMYSADSYYLRDAFTAYKSIHSPLTADEIKEEVISDFRDFIRTPPQFCDLAKSKRFLTELTLKVNPKSEKAQDELEYFNRIINRCDEGEVLGSYEFFSETDKIDIKNLIFHFAPLALLLIFSRFKRKSIKPLFAYETYAFVLIKRQFRIGLLISAFWLLTFIFYFLYEGYYLNPFLEKQLLVPYLFALLPITILLVAKFIISAEE